jgi:hypothetical protein
VPARTSRRAGAVDRAGPGRFVDHDGGGDGDHDAAEADQEQSRPRLTEGRVHADPERREACRGRGEDRPEPATFDGQGCPSGTRGRIRACTTGNRAAHVAHPLVSPGTADVAEPPASEHDVPSDGGHGSGDGRLVDRVEGTGEDPDVVLRPAEPPLRDVSRSRPTRTRPWNRPPSPQRVAVTTHPPRPGSGPPGRSRPPTVACLVRHLSSRPHAAGPPSGFTRGGEAGRDDVTRERISVLGGRTASIAGPSTVVEPPLARVRTRDRCLAARIRSPVHLSSRW